MYFYELYYINNIYNKNSAIKYIIVVVKIRFLKYIYIKITF